MSFELNFKSGAVWLAGLINLLLIGNVLILKYFDQKGEINYILDPINLILISCAVVVNISYWIMLGKEPVGVVFTSGLALGSAMHKVAKELSAKTFFFIKPMPSARAIEQHVASLLLKKEEINVDRKSDLVALMMEMKKLKILHLLAVLILVAALALGESLNYAREIKDIWFIVPLFMYVGMNILIYSVSVVLLSTFLKINRRFK